MSPSNGHKIKQQQVVCTCPGRTGGGWFLYIVESRCKPARYCIDLIKTLDALLRYGIVFANVILQEDTIKFLYQLKFAEEVNDEYVSVEHLFLALLEDKNNSTSLMLRNYVSSDTLKRQCP